MSLHKLLKLADSDHLPSDCKQWLLSGIDAYLAGSPLDEALNMKTDPGSRHPAKLHYMALRNKALREAWLHCDGIHDTQRTESLLRHLDLFERIFWPSHRALKKPPQQFSKLRTAIWWALFYAEKRQQPVPRSKRQLCEIVKKPV